MRKRGLAMRRAGRGRDGGERGHGGMEKPKDEKKERKKKKQGEGKVRR